MFCALTKPLSTWTDREKVLKFEIQIVACVWRCVFRLLTFKNYANASRNHCHFHFVHLNGVTSRRIPDDSQLWRVRKHSQHELQRKTAFIASFTSIDCCRLTRNRFSLLHHTLNGSFIHDDGVEPIESSFVSKSIYTEWKAELSRATWRIISCQLWLISAQNNHFYRTAPEVARRKLRKTFFFLCHCWCFVFMTKAWKIRMTKMFFFKIGRRFIVAVKKS